MEVSAAGVDGCLIDGIVKIVVAAEVEFGPVIGFQPIWRGNPMESDDVGDFYGVVFRVHNDPKEYGVLQENYNIVGYTCSCGVVQANKTPKCLAKIGKKSEKNYFYGKILICSYKVLFFILNY